MFHELRYDKKRITRIEYAYTDTPDVIMEANVSIGYGYDGDGLDDDGILFCFVDEAEFAEALTPGCFEFADMVFIREVI